MITAKRIVELRSEKGWSQDELAQKVGVHFRSVGRWERGVAIPGAEDILKLAQAFGVTADYLLFEGAARDGRIDISDPSLLKLFEEISTLDEKTRTAVKQILDAVVFKNKISQEVESRTGKK